MSRWSLSFLEVPGFLGPLSHAWWETRTALATTLLGTIKTSGQSLISGGLYWLLHLKIYAKVPAEVHECVEQSWVLDVLMLCCEKPLVRVGFRLYLNCKGFACFIGSVYVHSVRVGGGYYCVHVF